jgi:hypothetical protein
MEGPWVGILGYLLPIERGRGSVFIQRPGLRAG